MPLGLPLSVGRLPGQPGYCLSLLEMGRGWAASPGQGWSV